MRKWLSRIWEAIWTIVFLVAFFGGAIWIAIAIDNLRIG